MDDDTRPVCRVRFVDLVAWNFVPDGDDTFFCRNCNTANIKRASSNCNLIKHCAGTSCFGFKYRNVSHMHHNRDLQVIFKAYHDAQASITATNSHFQPTFSTKSKKLRAWIELVILCNLPLSVCENRVFCSHVKHDGMSRKTLRKYLIKLADIVGLVIRDIIGPGNCVADGWSCGGIHYLGIYHCWPSANSQGAITTKKALLSLAPFVTKDSLNAETQAASIEATYELYGSVNLLVKVLTLDNTNVNPATALIIAQ